MNDKHFDLAAAALDYVAAIKRESFNDAMADLADAALTFAAAAPELEDPDEFEDCCFG
jgi:hypothetical protein